VLGNTKFISYPRMIHIGCRICMGYCTITNLPDTTIQFVTFSCHIVSNHTVCITIIGYQQLWFYVLFTTTVIQISAIIFFKKYMFMLWDKEIMLRRAYCSNYAYTCEQICVFVSYFLNLLCWKL